MIKHCMYTIIYVCTRNWYTCNMYYMYKYTCATLQYTCTCTCQHMFECGHLHTCRVKTQHLHQLTIWCMYIVLHIYCMCVSM